MFQNLVLKNSENFCWWTFWSGSVFPEGQETPQGDLFAFEHPLFGKGQLSAPFGQGGVKTDGKWLRLSVFLARFQGPDQLRDKLSLDSNGHH
jgi:hypothetical protein